MIYLIVAVLTSSSVSIIMRWGEKHVKNNFAMFMANYITCSMIAAFFLLTSRKPIFLPNDGLGFAIGLGAFGGILYLSAFVLLKMNIGKNGVMLSSVFMKLGVLVPLAIAIIVFHDKPSTFQIIGMMISLAAIIVIYLEPAASDDEKRKKGSLIFLLALLLLGGLVESFANIYEKVGNSEHKDLYMLCVFISASLCCAAIVIFQKKRITPADAAFGIMIGIPNYFSTRFLLKALESVPAVVTYPVYNIGAIILIGLAGILLFKERPGIRKYIGFAMIICAIVFLNI